MDDRQFLNRVNGILENGQISLPPLEAEGSSAEAIFAWASFLEHCVRSGVRLSDPRWSRLAIVQSDPWTVFELQGEGDERRPDDFAVGLQLLMGMLGEGQN